ncbi:MAG: DUF4870 domain-containing protein [Acidimicrobiia bacterium]
MTPDPQPPAEPPQVSKDQQTWRVMAHASAFVQVVGIPSLVGPLVVWLMKRDDPVVEPHARRALNFQISLIIYTFVGIVTALMLAFTGVGIILSVVIVLFLIALIVLELIFALMAAIAASKGELYDYPLSLNLISH